MTDNSIVDIKTGKPVEPSGGSRGSERAALIQDGKRWKKLLEEMANGRISVSISAAGQELDIDEVVAPYLDSLIEDDAKADLIAKRRQRYIKSEKKPKT